jgi:predicted dienelactone hydrolase
VTPPRVRAFYRAAKVSGHPAPYNSVAMKVYYPCAYGDSFEERNTGFIPADKGRAPFPVVIVMPGINVSHEAYGWLALTLSEAGFVVVTYSWIAVEIADLVSITPGVRMKRLTPAKYGKKPSCPALKAIFRELQTLQQNSLLAGQLDLDHVILGGHSAGGTMALLNANTRWFAGLCGVFSYAAHTAANVQLGWQEDSIMPLSSSLPMMIMGGSRDGVIAASSHRYGDGEHYSATERIERTFHEGISGDRGDRHLLIVEGANHFSFAWPTDESTGRPFLDQETTGSDKEIRHFIAQIILNFCDHACTGDAMSAAEVQGMCNTAHPLAAMAASK